MKHGRTLLVLLAGGMALGGRANAVPTEPADTPYQTIVDRNVFSLKPPPPPPNADDNKPQPVKITLTGITTIFGDKRVLMKSPAPPGKPGEPAKPELSYILTEGQREGDIEVLEIDDKNGNVKLNNAGTIVTLNIDKDGPKLPTTPMAGVPGAPPAPGGVPIPHAPGANPMHNFSPESGGRPNFTMPTRTLRLPPTSAGGSPSAYNPMFTPTPISPGSSPVSQSVQQQQALQQQQQQQPAQSLEEQILMMEAEREANKNNPKFPPLPPTVATPSQDQTPSAPVTQPSGPGLPRPPGLPPVPQ